jgi:hypothetical protein
VGDLVRAIKDSPIGKAAGAVGDVGGGIGDAIGAVADFAGGATGGTIARSGPLWVGEEGPEIVDLPTGAKVTPNYALDERLTAGAGGLTVGGEANIHVHLEVGDRELAHVVRRASLRDLLATSPA